VIVIVGVYELAETRRGTFCAVSVLLDTARPESEETRSVTKIKQIQESESYTTLSPGAGKAAPIGPGVGL
jgi:hypothetical protein